MSYELIPTIFNLLSTVRLQYKEVALLGQLNSFFGFDHNIFLLDSSIDHNRYIATDCENDGHYTPQSLYIFGLAKSNVTGSESLNEIRSKNTFLIVVLAHSNFESNLKLLARVKEIQRLNKQVKIGVFFSHIDSIDSVRELFVWCWQHRILNVFSAGYFLNDQERAAESLNVFKFNPFGAFAVINVTTQSLANYFPNKFSNFQRHPLRVPIVDTPILYYDFKLWKIVIDKLNASFVMIRLNSSMPPSQVINGDIDVIPHLHAVDVNRNVYPMGSDKIVIVVPQALPFSDFMSYVRRITSARLFGYSFITIVAVSLLLTISSYAKEGKILFVQRVADVLHLLMNDNTHIKYQQLYRVDVCVVIPLTFAGFVVVNGILSIFQSYVTLPVMQPEINTIEDLYASPFPILAPGYWASEVPALLEHVSSMRDGWRDKVIPVDLQEVNELVFKFNTSISFPTFIATAKVCLEVQKRLDIWGYHIPTATYLVKQLNSYSVNDNFPFIERLNEIIHSLREAGLYDKWQEEHKEIMVTRLLRRNRSSHDAVVDRFPIPAVICYGWIASVIVFVSEIIWEKYKLSRLLRMRICLKQRRVH